MIGDPAPFVVASFINGEDSLPLLRPAAELSRAIDLVHELASAHAGRAAVLYAVDDRRFVRLVTVRK